MGECGCVSSGEALARIPGPEDIWYVLVSYPGCSYCSAPSGLDLVKLWGDDAETYYPYAPVLDWLPWGTESSILSFPIFSAEEIRKPLRGWLKDVHENAPDCMKDDIGRDVIAEDLAPELVQLARLHQPNTFLQSKRGGSDD